MRTRYFPRRHVLRQPFSMRASAPLGATRSSVRSGNIRKFATPRFCIGASSPRSRAPGRTSIAPMVLATLLGVFQRAGRRADSMPPRTAEGPTSGRAARRMSAVAPMPSPRRPVESSHSAGLHCECLPRGQRWWNVVYREAGGGGDRDWLSQPF